MSVGPLLEPTHTMLDLFENQSARHLFEKELAARVTRELGLPTASSPGTQIEKIIISLTKLDLSQTPDNQQTRQSMIRRATNDVRNQIRLKGIKRLSAEGIMFEAQYDVTAVSWHLVGQIWH